MSRPRKGPRLYLRPARHDRDAAIYYIRDGSREISTGCGPERYQEAEQALAAYIAAKYAPAYGKSDAGLVDILIDDVIAAYVGEHAPHTAEPGFIAHTAKPILEWWSGKTLADVRGKSCRDYVSWRTEQFVLITKKPRQDGSIPKPRRVSEATARHELSTLRAAINHWHREHGPLPAVPAVTLPEPADPKDDWLTRSQAAQMIKFGRRTRLCGHIPRLVLIGIYTGTRPGAILGLKWLPSTDSGWIDLDAGVLHRRGSDQRRSRKRQPPVRLPDRLLVHLRRWRQADLELAARLKTPVLNVVHYYGDRVQKLRRSWHTIAKAAGVPDATPHIVRHTAATWLMQAGADIYQAAGFLGMSVETLLRVYGHHHPDFQSEVANSARGRNRHTVTGTKPVRAPDTPQKPQANDVNEGPPASVIAMKRRGKPA